MDERTREPAVGGPGGPPPQRPWWPVALLLLGFVLAVFAAAILLDRQFRTPIGSDPALATVLASQPTATVRVTAPSAASTATDVVTAVAATQTTALVPTAATSPTAAAATAVPPTASAKTGIGTPSVASAQSTLARLPPLEREIAEAYLRYWDVRTQAYFDLDTSRLPDVMAGAELEREETTIRELRAQGRAVRFDVEHSFAVRKATQEEGLVYDEYVNRSVVVDAATKQAPPPKGPPPIEKVSFELKKLDGTWKVVDGVRHD